MSPFTPNSRYTYESVQYSQPMYNKLKSIKL